MNVIPFKPRPTLDSEKQKLIDLAMRHGLSDQQTIDQSHRVDNLVVIEQRLALKVLSQQQAQVSADLPVGLRLAMRPSVTARAARRVDKAITRVQERLEQDDTAGQKILAYSVIIMTAVYILGAAFR